ncbi:hypothetical protein ARTHROSP310_02550 [Arthrobacter sp. AD-310]
MGMFHEPEVRALLAIVERLAGRFPGHERSVIEQIVAEEHLVFDGVAVRDYVPILVEKAAKSRLTRAGASSVEAWR